MIPQINLYEFHEDNPNFPILEDNQIQIWKIFCPCHDQHHATAYDVLKQLLSRISGISPCDIVLTLGTHGKPLWEDSFNKNSLSFNLSHSGDWIVIALSKEFPLGIDIEQIQPRTNILHTARKAFSSQEYEQLITYREGSQAEEFYRLWTKKEALLKGLGVGFFQPDIATIGWHTHSFQPADGYMGCVAFSDGTGESL